MFDAIFNQHIAIHGGGGGSGLIGALDSLLAMLETLFSLPPSQLPAALLPGLAAMRNLHPLFVHFPIALLTLFLPIDAAGCLAGKPQWRRVADWFLYAGTLFAALTVALGLSAESTVAHAAAAHELMEIHEQLGLTILGLAATLSAWRLLAGDTLRGAGNALHLTLAAALCLLLVFAADLGGLMVYHHGVAVSGSDTGGGDSDHPHDHDHSH